MAKIKSTKSAVDAAQPQAAEFRDTVVPGFLCKITLVRKVFMLSYRTNAGLRCKLALGQFGELTVDQIRVMAQEWLVDGRPQRGYQGVKRPDVVSLRTHMSPLFHRPPEVREANFSQETRHAMHLKVFALGRSAQLIDVAGYTKRVAWALFTKYVGGIWCRNNQILPLPER